MVVGARNLGLGFRWMAVDAKKGADARAYNVSPTPLQCGLRLLLHQHSSGKCLVGGVEGEEDKQRCH